MSHDTSQYGFWTGKRIASLLKIGRMERPVDGLLERLRGSQGPSWLFRSLEAQYPGDGVRLYDRLISGQASLEELKSMKEHSKALFSAEGEDQRHVALAGYVLSVAAALVHHRECISSRSNEDLVPIFQDLAAVLPGPWSELLERAAEF